MDTTHYWLFATEYSIWNAAVAALQFWMADPEPHILSDVIEQVYTAFFCSNSAQQLQNQSEEIIFGHFMTTLNDMFEWALTQENEEYESGSESLSTYTPLRRTLRVFHISMSENLSFSPTMPLTTARQHPEHSPRRFRSCSSVCHHLTFSSSDEESPTPDSSPLHGRAEQPSLLPHHMDYQHTPTPNTDGSFQDATAEEEEDFPTAS